MLIPSRAAVILAPMEGITDAPMRALQGATGAFSYAVSEFIRVSGEPVPRKVFLRDVPELSHCATTPTGLPVQVQILGGDPGRMAVSALNAIAAGATAIDINFGCPAPTVNRNDGGASILREPCRVRDIVAAVRSAVPVNIPVSAKLRLGWDSIETIYETSQMAAEGGASWITIHARTRVQGYQPPVFWEPIGRVREMLDIPVVANGDIWTLDDFRRCRDETGCSHFMLGRSALANPPLPCQVAAELGLAAPVGKPQQVDWLALMKDLATWTAYYQECVPKHAVLRFKQWLNLASKFGEFKHFDDVKRLESVDDVYRVLAQSAEMGLAS